VEGFASDWCAMEWADTGVLVLPSGRSAHLEAGYFVGAGKPLYIVMLEAQQPELMYRMARRVCLTMDELLVGVGTPVIVGEGAA
jgi:nucleoside 2-deoxyribosyltransferase